MFLATSSDFDGRDQRLLLSYSPNWDRRKWIDRTGVPRGFAHCRRTKELPERDPVTVHSVERQSRRVDIEISIHGVVLAQSNTEHKRRASDEFTRDI